MKKSLLNPVTKFLLFATCGYILWYLCYELLIKPYTGIDRFMSIHLVDVTATFLRWFGYKTQTMLSTDMVIIYIDGSHGVRVGDPCNGISLMALFSVFILAFPGKIKNKLWYLPMGILIVHFVNICRIFALTIIAFDTPELLDFNHNYTFTIIVYSVIFILWFFWGKYYSGFIAKKDNK